MHKILQDVTALKPSKRWNFKAIVDGGAPVPAVITLLEILSTDHSGDPSIRRGAGAATHSTALPVLSSLESLELGSERITLLLKWQKGPPAEILNADDEPDSGAESKSEGISEIARSRIDFAARRIDTEIEHGSEESGEDSDNVLRMVLCVDAAKPNRAAEYATNRLREAFSGGTSVDFATEAHLTAEQDDGDTTFSASNSLALRLDNVCSINLSHWWTTASPLQEISTEVLPAVFRVRYCLRCANLRSERHSPLMFRRHQGGHDVLCST